MTTEEQTICRICHALVARERTADHSEWHRDMGQWPPSAWGERTRTPLFARRMEIQDAVDYFEKVGGVMDMTRSQNRSHYLDVLIRAAKDYLL